MIYYTTDGSDPTLQSALFEEPFSLPLGGPIKARVIEGKSLGPVSELQLGIDRALWKAKASSVDSKRFAITAAFDGNASSCWQSKTGQAMPQFIAIDLGKTYSIKGFTYLPRQRTRKPEGMIEKAYIEVSQDGINWRKVQDVEFGNICNDPSLREVVFDRTVQTRNFKIVVTAGPLGSDNVGIAEIEILLK